MDFFTTQESKSFINDLMDIDNFLDKAIQWIEFELKPNQVFNEDKLEKWALDNGFEKKGK